MEHNQVEAGTEDGETPATVDTEETYLSKLTNPFNPMWPITCLVSVTIGVYLCTFAVAPKVPQESAAFKPPFKAIEYIEQNRPSGNLLNDPHFGATMIYKMRNNPPVFIDPRYNLYGNKLLQDYWHMVNCDSDYEQLLDYYKIDWIFLQPNAELPKRLTKDPHWRLLYSDSASVIYARTKDL